MHVSGSGGSGTPTRPAAHRRLSTAAAAAVLPLAATTIAAEEQLPFPVATGRRRPVSPPLSPAALEVSLEAREVDDEDELGEEGDEDGPHSVVVQVHELQGDPGRDRSLFYFRCSSCPLIFFAAAKGKKREGSGRAAGGQASTGGYLDPLS